MLSRHRFIDGVYASKFSATFSGSPGAFLRPLSFRVFSVCGSMLLHFRSTISVEARKTLPASRKILSAASRKGFYAFFGVAGVTEFRERLVFESCVSVEISRLSWFSCQVIL
jgi:hypothetical protein